MINHQSGFIALMSAIIISVLLLIIAITIGMTGIFGRFNVLDSESKERSSALAEACVDTAVLNIINVVTQPLGKILVGPKPDDKCTIISVTPSGNNYIIITKADINKAFTNVVVEINANYNIVSWEETLN